jgi:hypothetical protein
MSKKLFDIETRKRFFVFPGALAALLFWEH